MGVGAWRVEAMLEWQDAGRRLRFVNIAGEDYDPKQYLAPRAAPAVFVDAPTNMYGGGM